MLIIAKRTMNGSCSSPHNEEWGSAWQLIQAGPFPPHIPPLQVRSTHTFLSLAPSVSDRRLSLAAVCLWPPSVIVCRLSLFLSAVCVWPPSVSVCRLKGTVAWDGFFARCNSCRKVIQHLNFFCSGSTNNWDMDGFVLLAAIGECA